MARTIGIGHQDFGEIRSHNNFYVDKTDFIREWWNSYDAVTLITRPRRFGKTLNMSMTEQFFSVRYTGRGELFEGLRIWEDETFRKLQGTFPVLSLSFANVKEDNYHAAIQRVCQIFEELYENHRFLLEGDLLSDGEKEYFRSVSMDMPLVSASMAIHRISKFLSRYYNKKVIILLDEYDTPMQEAYVNGYWEKLVSFFRSLFNATFKTNPYLERAIMTGVTRVSRESMFSDLNNLKVVTTTSEKYEDSFGFTEKEVFAALDEYGMAQKRAEVKKWYDGFTFGRKTDIYNPWSIINYLDDREVGLYWANTSSNKLSEKLIREGHKEIKEEFECLLQGGTFTTFLDEQIVYDQLLTSRAALWSLLLASGYLKVVRIESMEDGRRRYTLALTNMEVCLMFEDMFRGWFSRDDANYNDFVKAFLAGDLEAMNLYMNDVTQSMFSSFDTGKKPSKREPERFYHGFVLGLMAELKGRYILTSNRESGFGRYDVMLEPKESGDDAMLLEFKVFQPAKEKELSDTVKAALKQIEEKKYEVSLLEKGISKERIRKYGFAFRGSEVLIG